MEPARPDYWTPRRLVLRSWFEKNAPSLGELYEGAVEMVFRDTFPGRVRFVAHAVREIRNRLPDVIAGPKQSGQLQYTNRMDHIGKIWKQHGLPLDGSLPMTVTEAAALPSGPSNEVSIPRNLYKAIAGLVIDHVQTREKPVDAAKGMFEAIDPRNKESEATLRPRIVHWLKTTEWFVERMHDRGKTDAEMDGGELKSRFRIFESALYAMVGEFFKSVEELDAILEDANS